MIRRKAGADVSHVPLINSTNGSFCRLLSTVARTSPTSTLHGLGTSNAAEQKQRIAMVPRSSQARACSHPRAISGLAIATFQIWTLNALLTRFALCADSKQRSGDLGK